MPHQESLFEGVDDAGQRVRILKYIEDTQAGRDYVESVERRWHRQAETRANSQALRDALILEGQQGRYPVVLADPPWAMPDGKEALPGREAANHYPVADVESIKAMDIRCIADDAVLFLWTTIANLRNAFDVLDAWGFEYKQEFVWAKPHYTTGFLLRHQHEPMLIGTRGNWRADFRGDRGISTVLQAPTSRHSRKPSAVHEMIERLYPDLPKLELFARMARPGWTSWGNEV